MGQGVLQKLGLGSGSLWEKKKKIFFLQRTLPELALRFSDLNQFLNQFLTRLELTEKISFPLLASDLDYVRQFVRNALLFCGKETEFFWWLFCMKKTKD